MKILKIKTENIITFCYIPFAIANILEADLGLIASAIFIHLLLISGLHYAIRTTRHELMKDIKSGCYDDYLELFNNFFKYVKLIKNCIKKEVIRSELKTTKLKDAFLKYNF